MVVHVVRGPETTLDTTRLSAMDKEKSFVTAEVQYINKQEDPLRSYSLVSAIVCLFVLIIVLKFVGNE